MTDGTTVEVEAQAFTSAFDREPMRLSRRRVGHDLFTREGLADLADALSPSHVVSFSVTFSTARTDRAAARRVHATLSRRRVTPSELGTDPRRDLAQQTRWRGTRHVVRAARRQRR